MIANNGEIVLFSEEKVGVIVKGTVNYEGYYSKCWDMKVFKDFYDSITMSNL